MLVISNGALKSGSTWLTTILMKMLNPKAIPPIYADPAIPAMPTIKGSRLRRFLDEVDYANEHYVSKNHFLYERHLLSKYPNVYVFDITRDLADTLVSLYFHSKKKLESLGEHDEHIADMARAYAHYGATSIQSIVRHHAVWGVPRPWIYVSSYERLKTDPHREIAAIGAFLGLTLSDDAVEHLIAETTIDKLKAAHAPDSRLAVRFRKGEIGDHRNYLTPEMLADIRRIEAENVHYPATIRERLEFAFHSRRAARHRGGDIA